MKTDWCELALTIGIALMCAGLAYRVAVGWC